MLRSYLLAGGDPNTLSGAQKAIIPDQMESVTLEAALAYGSGGASCIVVAQTSLDGGVTWRDIARFDFATSSAVKQAVIVSGAKGVLSYSALGAEGVNDGILGTQIRAVITATGGYVGASVLLRAVVR